MHRRTLLAVAVFALSIVIVTSTGSFTSASADRGVSVAVVGDDEAFIGVETNPLEIDNGNHEVVLLTVTNRFDSDVEDVQAFAAGETEGPPPIVTDMRTPDHIGVSDTISVKGRVTCSNATPGAEVPVHLTVRTDGTTVEMTRWVWIDCTGDPPGNNSNKSTSSDQSANNSSTSLQTAPTAGS